MRDSERDKSDRGGRKWTTVMKRDLDRPVDETDRDRETEREKDWGNVQLLSREGSCR